MSDAGRTRQQHARKKAAAAEAAPAPQPRVAKRARALVREQLKYGPRPGAQVEAAAMAADIPKPVLLAATDALGVKTKRGEWQLPG